MKAAAKESRARAKGARAEDDLKAVLDAIAAMDDTDRALCGRLHEVITAAAPELAPRTWYGMPAYAKDGKVLCFVQGAAKFKERYSVNELSLLGSGDILLLATDGLYEHGDDSYVPELLEQELARTRDLPALEISEALKRSILEFAAPKDDISFVVIKRG